MTEIVVKIGTWFLDAYKTTIRILKMTFNTLGFLPTFSSLFEGVSAVRSNCFRIWLPGYN